MRPGGLNIPEEEGTVCPECGAELDSGATECFLCGTIISSQDAAPVAEEPTEEPLGESVEEAYEEPASDEFVCPMCGTSVGADVVECPGCGEKFTPIEDETTDLDDEFIEEPSIEDEDVYEETTYEESEEVLEVPEDVGEVAYCPDCDTQLDEDGNCPTCSPPVHTDEATDGCPICGSKSFSVESGDLVSCSDCGNVYIRKEYGGIEQSWKWKFWVGLVFILVGDLGVALGSYVHNVMGWSPLGQMYLGYGWIDQIVGVVGIVLFTLGLILFAWSFKREREVQCPSCKVIVQESQLTEAEPEEEEEVPEELAVETALEEIGEVMECPACGAEVSMFDTSCPSCGVLFEIEDEYDDEYEEPLEEPEEAEPEKLLSGSEIDENELVMESLELEEPEINGESLEALDELESSLEESLDDLDMNTCPSCGAIVGKGLDTCPGCGATLNGEGGE